MNDYPAGRKCPHHLPEQYASWREEAPATRVTLPGGHAAWLVTRYEDVRRLLRGTALSSDSTGPAYPRSGSAVEVPPLNRTMIGLDGQAHNRLRRMLGPEFSASAVARLGPRLDRIVAATLDRLAAGERPADLVEGFALPVASRTICHLLGLGYDAHASFEHNTHVLTAGSSTPQQKVDAGAAIVGLVADLVRQRLRKHRDDLAGRLTARWVATGELSEEEAVHNLALLLGAGHDTSANMIALGALSLLLDPALARRFRVEQGVRQNVVEELLRHHTIVQLGLARVATADIGLGDLTIRSGEGVVLSLQAANTDPRLFDDPGRLDPDRPNARQHLAFGFGPHTCLGHGLARATIRSALAGLLDRLPSLRLAEPVEALQFKDPMDFHGPRRLPVSW